MVERGFMKTDYVLELVEFFLKNQGGWEDFKCEEFENLPEEGQVIEILKKLLIPQ